MNSFIQKLARKKYIDISHVSDTQLARCLNTLDLTALGIGSTLGAGIYVVAGQVARETAGPSVAISFLIAALASILAGLCYAEFGARVPRTGSAYVYSYVTVGELMAFVIGWNLILEYVIGTASVARAWSSYFDSLIDNKIQNFFKENVPMSISGLSPYPDFFALGITLLLTVILAVGVKESSRFNNLFTGVNLLVVTYIVICGAFKADPHNWNIKPSEVKSANVTVGDGGFIPFGFSGMISGAATCFYAFVGFDAIATTGEEVQNPQKAIPISIVISLLACFLAYFGISTVITLMCPYYLLDVNAPLPAVFERVGWDVAKYIIAVGAICGLSTSLLSGMFPLPRILYAIASDGLIFRFLSKVNERLKTPFIATVLSGIFAGVMAMLFDLSELVDMMSIGTLLAYTLVAVCVLLLRYKVMCIGGLHDTADGDYNKLSQTDPEENEEYNQVTITKPLINRSGYSSHQNIFQRIFCAKRQKEPTAETENVVTVIVWIFCLVVVISSVFLLFGETSLFNGEWWAVVTALVLGVSIIFMFVSIFCQPQNQTKLSFKVPWLPLLPMISIFVNIFLMLRLSYQTWIRFGIWMFIGFLIYFTYGIHHSSEAKPRAIPFELEQETSQAYEEEERLKEN
ncbi:hypothetical protein CHS0354_039728 [Potamilus streckersoni]|uniref:Cationic amino acid transporter C-terminal domain-containing protein n=1 Tax=Potamilus streckersoni TaxID=2493646 RepID=A0AAE0SY59_9BIVA|nr:hypothetical protein CHS0354_039728 [Potamilus streckersoni]